MNNTTSYDVLTFDTNGNGPFRHQFKTEEAREQFVTDNPGDYTYQTVDNSTGEIVNETVEAEKEGTEPVKDTDNQRNQTADTLTDTNGETPIFDHLTAETPNTGE